MQIESVNETMQQLTAQAVLEKQNHFVVAMRTRVIYYDLLPHVSETNFTSPPSFSLLRVGFEGNALQESSCAIIKNGDVWVVVARALN